MITVENVTRRYGDFIAVDKASFTIGQGEIVGLLGHNGAGKTTVMKMLTGYLEPTEGKITINGKDICGDRQRVQEEIGYLPENCPVYPEMTVIAYLEYAASLQGIPADKRSALVVEAIVRTALTDKAHQNIATLSRGYRQRVGVAQAILHKPGILVLDEPTNGLDPTQILQMRELIKDLAQNATIIISTHILQEVQAVCDRVIIVKNGRKALDSRIDLIQNEARLIVDLDAAGALPMEILAKIPGVVSVVENNTGLRQKDMHSYALELKENSSRQEVAASAAKAIHDKGWSLYSLSFETRDLETVFAQISVQ